MPGLRPRLRLRRSRVGFGRLVTPVREESRDLIVQHALRHFLDLAALQLAELEGTIGDPDQPVDRQPHALHHIADFAVLALAQRDGQPRVGPLLAVEHRFDRPVLDAVDGDAARKPDSRLGSTKPFTRTR